MSYCTIAQARAAGATGTDEEVTAAIATARRLIDRYTGSVWEPTEATVVARVAADGTALLPWPVRTITSVTPVGSPTAIAAAGYTVLSSLVPGQVDAVVLGSLSVADPLVVGAEPWRGGWANLLGSTMRTGQVTVAGMFGPDSVPPEVQDAAAQLAAWRRSGGTFTARTEPDTDDEGNAVSITVDTTRPVPLSRTTGVGEVDALLDTLGTRTPAMIN